MGRSVVRAGAARCPRCCLQPRWCICDVLPQVATDLPVHVFIHRHEHAKPSSTGRLVTRAVTGVTSRIYQRQSRFFPAAGFPVEALAAGRELWILHPSGEPLPLAADRGDAATPARPQILLLDATWRQAGEMLRTVEGLGRCVRLPDSSAEPSRYWLRDQPARSHLSTAEALMAIFRALGETAAEHRLRLHFELHVYAMLLSRGRRESAERYLGHSPLLAELPDVVDALAQGVRTPAGD
jgi:DTW domain-containing protein YfiP